jgi:DNA-binding helix-hairpin-helix protein with protein kinase domain
LGQELGRGGEGAVLAVEGQRDLAAKIYLKPPDHQKAQKLVAMAEAASPAMLKIAAWPIDLLLDAKGAPRGFLMPRVVARRDIHELYSPKSRSEAFPEADFRFLAHVAANIARAFAVVHEHGHVIGDVNHGNLLAAADGTVMLIDCDSFQTGSGANAFTCDVGSPLFTAPEIQGTPFRGLIRVTNHDRFGLAVLLFHLLFMGRHPFAGRYAGPNDMPPERAIAEYRFAYGPDRAASGMERPPGTIALETMSPPIPQFFVQSFGRTGSTGQRPDARSWIGALETLRSTLRVCSKANWHQYSGELTSCPWCAVEAQTGARLFGHRLAASSPSGAINLAALWNAIAQVPEPGADPPLPSERRWQKPADFRLPSRLLKNARKALSIGIVCAGLAACNTLANNGGAIMGLILYCIAAAVWPWVSNERKAAAERVYVATQSEWQGALDRWKREASQGVFTQRRRALETMRAGLSDLPNERRRRVAVLEAERETRQRHRYLDRFRIDRAKVRGIGPSRVAMLASYGIETAADINDRKIMTIPGFGPALSSELLKWRRGHERNFRFNPSEPIDQSDILALDRELDDRRRNMLTSLQQGPQLLRRQCEEISAARLRLMPLLEQKWTELKIAEAQKHAL